MTNEITQEIEKQAIIDMKAAVTSLTAILNNSQVYISEDLWFKIREISSLATIVDMDRNSSPSDRGEKDAK